MAAFVWASDCFPPVFRTIILDEWAWALKGCCMYVYGVPENMIDCVPRALVPEGNVVIGTVSETIFARGEWGKSNSYASLSGLCLCSSCCFVFIHFKAEIFLKEGN